MGLETTLASQLDSIPVNDGRIDIVCDGPHDPPRAVDDEGPVQYECIRIDESITLFDGLPVYGTWFPDLLRCSECERDELRDPTDGYDEALVAVDLGWRGNHRVIDASDLSVIDFSPADDGTDPPPVPKSLVDTGFQQRDFGMLRRSRLTTTARELRARGEDDLAARVEQGLSMTSGEPDV